MTQIASATDRLVPHDLVRNGCRANLSALFPKGTDGLRASGSKQRNLGARIGRRGAGDLSGLYLRQAPGREGFLRRRQLLQMTGRLENADRVSDRRSGLGRDPLSSRTMSVSLPHLRLFHAPRGKRSRCGADALGFREQLDRGSRIVTGEPRDIERRSGIAHIGDRAPEVVDHELECR